MEIIINTIPPVAAARPGRLISIGTIRAGMSPEAENANCSVVLDNADGYFSRLFAVAPLGVAAVVNDQLTTVFDGSITAVELSATCILTLEA
jgi:hypothetical protein